MITIVNNVLTTYSYLQSDVSLGRGDRAPALSLPRSNASLHRNPNPATSELHRLNTRRNHVEFDLRDSLKASAAHKIMFSQSDNVLFVQSRNVLLRGYTSPQEAGEEYGWRGHYRDECARVTAASGGA